MIDKKRKLKVDSIKAEKKGDKLLKGSKFIPSGKK